MRFLGEWPRLLFPHPRPHPAHRGHLQRGATAEEAFMPTPLMPTKRRAEALPGEFFLFLFLLLLLVVLATMAMVSILWLATRAIVF